MDAVVLKAGVVMAAGLLLLVPTFNALNQSYVQNVPPPPWIPKDVTPPDITPPSDMTPPPDFKPPPDYKGKIPPQSCPPPVLRYLNATNDQADLAQGRGQPGWSVTRQFTVPENAAVVGVAANYTNWQASSITTGLQSPQRTEYTNTTNGDAALTSVQPQKTSDTWDSYHATNAAPPSPGNWTLTASATFPIGGTVQFTYLIVLPCGGLLNK